jgi:predicted transcriptional regulator
VRKLIERSGMSQRAVAKLIGMTERNFYRYTAGVAEMPTYVELAVRHVLECQHGTEKAAG